jgi:hypothetical protein
MYFLKFVLTFCFALCLVSIIFIAKSMFSKTAEQIWHNGVNSLIGVVILAVIFNGMQGVLWPGCAIQYPPLSYLVIYLPQVLFLPVVWYLERAMKAKKNGNVDHTEINLFFAQIYCYLILMIPMANIVLGFGFHYRQ